MSAARMRAAGEIIAREAARLASAWSEEIPPSIKVLASDHAAIVISGVGPSYPNEVKGVRHPVFGPTAVRKDPPWVTNAYRPFLAPAAEAKLDEASAEAARVVDDMAEALGFVEVP